MRHALIAVLFTVAVLGMPASGQGPRPGIDNVAAFARLYGVVRYFYPSDAAATSTGTGSPFTASRKCEPLRDAKALQSTLQTLFSPLGPRIEIGEKLPPPTRREALTVFDRLALPRCRHRRFECAGPIQRETDPSRAGLKRQSWHRWVCDGHANGPGDEPARAGRFVFADSFALRRVKSLAQLPCGCGSTGQISRWVFSTTWETGPFAIPSGRSTPSRVRLRKMRRASRSVSWPSASSRQTSSGSNSPCERRWLLDTDRH